MIEKIKWGGWENVYRIWNHTVQVLVLADVGPRIIWYGFQGGENILHEVADDAGRLGGTEFRIYGGHRLWVSPEVDRTYFPDNRPVSVQEQGKRLRFTAPIEDIAPGTHLQKELELELEQTGSRVHLLHRVINCDREVTALAAWAPTMMRAGGRAVLPLPPRAPMDKDHLRPAGPFTLWSYTDFTDPRWRLGTDYIQLVQCSNPTGRFQEQMTGIFNPHGWGAYFRAGTLFVKRAPVIPNAVYPDYGCNFELFTNCDFLELETLGPMVVLKSGEQVTHPEVWELHHDVAAGEDENWIRSVVAALASEGST